MRRLILLPGACLSLGALLVASQAPPLSRDVAGWMSRVGERVEQYYARAQSVICEETVRLQPLAADLAPDGSHIRELVYELRVAWDGEPDPGKVPVATVLRTLQRVDGRPPRPGDEPGCLDPKPVSPEPLGMLLPHRQGDFVFAWRGQGRERGRASVTFDYKSARVQPADVVWKGDCATVDLPGRTRGRIWLDQATAEVLRLDEELTGQYEVQVPKTRARRAGQASSFTVERADTTTLYRAVAFHDPEETVLLPDSIVSLQVIRNSGVPRLRTWQTFTKYRRFITGARMVPPPESARD